jgi:3-phosphoshikimate 1-carboxyvinyltransferase
MMEEFGVYGQWHDNTISVSQQNYQIKRDVGYTYKVEGDWSSASYWYAIAALSETTNLTIKGLKNTSLQGDAIVAAIFTFFGVKTEYISDGIRITKQKVNDEHFGFDFSDCPDLAQTVAVVVAALKIPSLFNGLHTLRIKETDRVQALKIELKKIGVQVEILNDNSIKINNESLVKNPLSIETYEDHRMAMAFACLSLKHDSVLIESPEVVKKSYPNFWKDLKHLGFSVEEII